MQSDNKLFSDLAKLGQSAAGTLHGAKAEVKNQIKTRLETALQDMDLASREEFDVVREMAAAAREENALLLKRVETLEQEITKSRKKKK